MDRFSVAAANVGDGTEPVLVAEAQAASRALGEAQTCSERVRQALEEAMAAEREVREAMDNIEHHDAQVRCAAFPSARIARLTDDEKAALADEVETAYRSNFEQHRYATRSQFR